MNLMRSLNKLLLVLLALNLAACNPVLKGVGDSLLLATGIRQTPLEQKAVNPTAGYLKVTSGPEALFVLGFREHGRETWYGSGPIAITKVNGVVIASSGIDRGHDLSHHLVSGVGAHYFSVGLHTLTANQSVPLQRTRSVLGGVQQHTQAYELVFVGEESVSVWAGQRELLLRIEERPIQSAHQITWPGAVYWVTADTGAMVASQQWLSPNRRYTLVPREAQKLLQQPEHDQVLSAVTLTQTARLSDVLRRDARWLQQPALAVFSQAKTAQAKRLQNGLLIDVRVAEASTTHTETRSVLQRLHANIQALNVSGRWALTVTDPYWLEVTSAQNPILAVGDTVMPVTLNSPVTIIKPNGDICRQSFVPQQSVQGYLNACTVPRLSHGVMVTAQGESIPLALGLWNKQPTPSVGPGAVIATPIKGLPLAASNELAKLWWMESME